MYSREVVKQINTGTLRSIFASYSFARIATQLSAKLHDLLKAFRSFLMVLSKAGKETTS